ncbi:hypothetical protein K432DRAFT_54253 [Lepidopterella palustris CBS 459.81]|uniref:Uncharacterized protein n=1 Tax=Lepidopterella palustris CBS 459.81 TaxID=1314670 RepID=A0A8E2E9Q0_9PEZI|nr:hypothetical protein K432DRAFT_54253 [Lepidopterella palustris CBS 459.81]
MIVLFVKHRTSSHFNPNGLGTDDFYYAGVFDLETWTCEVNRFQDTTPELDFSHTIDLYGKQCALERAGRWMMIPLMVVSLVVAGVVIFQFVMLKRERNMSESREEGCELDDHGCPLHEH